MEKYTRNESSLGFMLGWHNTEGSIRWEMLGNLCFGAR